MLLKSDNTLKSTTVIPVARDDTYPNYPKDHEPHLMSVQHLTDLPHGSIDPIDPAQSVSYPSRTTTS